MEVLVAGSLQDLCQRLKKKVNLTQVPDYSAFLDKLREFTYDLVVLESALAVRAAAGDDQQVGFAQVVPLVKQLQAKAGVAVLTSPGQTMAAPKTEGVLILENSEDLLEKLLESVPLRPRKLPAGTSEIVWGKGETIHFERGSSDPELRNDLTAFLELKGRQLAGLCGESDYFGTEWTGPEHQSVALSQSGDNFLALAKLQSKTVSLTKKERELIAKVFGVNS